MDLEDNYLFIIIKRASQFTNVTRKKTTTIIYSILSIDVLKGIKYRFK